MSSRDRLLRSTALAAAAALVLGAGGALAQERTFSFDIPAESLSRGLQDYGRETHQQLLFTEDLVAGKSTAGIRGPLSAGEALHRLLDGSGLSAVRTASGALVIQRGGAAEAPAAGGPAVEAPDRASSVEEVVVTAQKRRERLLEVPVPVTVVQASTLSQEHLLRLQDYYSLVPGLTVTPAQQSSQVLAIRGITTGPGTVVPTVGVTVDDVPYGASTPSGQGLVVPDLDPSDLASVEVLRGPQGTLYGASSLGGLLKFVTVDPSTDGFSGRLEVGADGVSHSGDVGYNVRGAVNLPLGPNLATRVSAFTRQDPGYIDNVLTGKADVNEQHVSGGRVSTLWKVTDNLSIKADALYQLTRGDGSSDVDVLPGLSGLQQSYMTGTGAYTRRVQVYSATVRDEIGAVQLTSVTGYSVNFYRDSLDYSFGLGGVGGLSDILFGVTGAPVTESTQTKKLTQEVRLSGVLSHRLDWTAGAFYDHERSASVQDLLAADTSTGQVRGTFISGSFPSSYDEGAGFLNLTYHFSPKFDVQLGGRQSYYRQTTGRTQSGTLIGPTPVTTESDSSDNAFTFLVTPRWRLSSDFMIYARLASGYRPGGSNLGIGVPLTYGPDKTYNYEIGAKGNLFDGRVILDASLYYIDWRNIQVGLVTPGGPASYTGNAGAAKSEGIELSVQARPISDLTLGGWLTYGTAELTEGFPPNSTAYGVAGDRLPYNSRFSGRLSAEKEFPLGNDWTGVAGGEVSFIGKRYDVFTTTPARQVLPSYTRIDLHAGIRNALWSATAFVNNVADTRGILGGGIGNLIPFAFQYIQPRMIGVSIARQF